MNGHEQTICLVPCASRKCSSRALARDLYESALFRKMRAVVEELGTPWFILSAKHGLVQPDQPVDPYDLTLKDMRVSERRLWAERVIGQMERVLPPADRVVVFAGKTYREFLMDWPKKADRRRSRLPWRVFPSGVSSSTWTHGWRRCGGARPNHRDPRTSLRLTRLASALSSPATA